MTGFSKLFSSYPTCSGKDKVKIANGSLTTISAKGLIVLSTSLSLSLVLRFPEFSHNLLSVNSLTKQMNYTITFIHLIASFRIWTCKQR